MCARLRVVTQRDNPIDIVYRITASTFELSRAFVGIGDIICLSFLELLLLTLIPVRHGPKIPADAAEDLADGSALTHDGSPRFLCMPQ